MKGVGVDCGGLIYELFCPYLQLQPFPTDYPADWAMHQNAELYLDFIKEHVKETSYPVLGGLVIFQYGRSFSHAGLVATERTVIHAWGRTEFGSVQESNWAFFNLPGKARPRRYYDVI